MAYQRYQYSNIVTDPTTNRRRKETIIYSEIPRSIDDLYIIAQRGDRLDLYAAEYYDDVTRWSVIARANNIGKGTMEVEAGTQIRIPALINDIDTNDRKLNE